MAQYFLNIEKFSELTKNFNFSSLANLDGIGETQINSLKNFFSDQVNLNVVKKLIPIQDWNQLHLRMIFYGREWCQARKTKCECKICSQV